MAVPTFLHVITMQAPLVTHSPSSSSYLSAVEDNDPSGVIGASVECLLCLSREAKGGKNEIAPYRHRCYQREHIFEIATLNTGIIHVLSCSHWETVTSRPLLLRVWSGGDGGSACQVGKHFRREDWGGESPCLRGGRMGIHAVSGVTLCSYWGHGASDSLWPKATGVCHLQMAICPLVERHFDCWSSQAGSQRSRWHGRAANRDVFFWHRPFMNMEILSKYFLYWGRGMNSFLITDKYLRHSVHYTVRATGFHKVAAAFLPWLLTVGGSLGLTNAQTWCRVSAIMSNQHLFEIINLNDQQLTYISSGMTNFQQKYRFSLRSVHRLGEILHSVT